MTTQLKPCLSRTQRGKLRAYRAAARRRAKTIAVQAHERVAPPRLAGEAARLARLEELEYAAHRLCSDVDRRGTSPHDKKVIAQVVALLEDLVATVHEGS